MRGSRERVFEGLFEYYLLGREGRFGRMPDAVEIRRARGEDNTGDEFS